MKIKVRTMIRNIAILLLLVEPFYVWSLIAQELSYYEKSHSIEAMMFLWIPIVALVLLFVNIVMWMLGDSYIEFKNE